jgi:serine protease Do
MNLFHKSAAARAVSIAVLVAGSMAGGYLFAQKGQASASQTPVLSPAASASAGSEARADSPRSGVVVDFADIAAQQGPAVVNISVSGKVKTAFSGFPGGAQIDPEDPFAELFKRFQGAMPQDRAPVRGTGSGFIVDPAGVVLTNAHVVADADEVTVKLTDKREFKAKVVGVDKLSDVAVLRINAKDLPSVKIGEPQKSKVGEWVVAIGSPFGLENTVTAGIVSAKSRTLPDEGYVPFLQTDVPINPGNSGGPLFNLRGEVIGINSQIFTRSGGYQGLSFAIPIDVAMKVEKQLVDHGKVSRGRLGIAVQEVSSELAESFGMDKPQGALVNSVERDSPAANGGIQPGDVILQFNGNSIGRSADLPPLVADVTPGNSATLNVWRKGKTLALNVRVGELETAQAQGTGNADTQGGGLGLAVRPLTPKERSQAQVVAGLVVEEVKAGPAQRAGVQTGDVILAVNGELVSSVEQLRAQTKKGDKKIALLVQRGDERLYLPLNKG